MLKLHLRSAEKEIIILVNRLLLDNTFKINGNLSQHLCKPSIFCLHTYYRKKAAPAYERYEYLAREGPPSLALPGKYRRLLEVFQGTDTVVSMLYNRQEVITFSKLQTAVQSMTRK